jgi:hypothetical protein
MSRFEGIESYIETPDLMMAVNAAITLERPLRARSGGVDGIRQGSTRSL